MVGLWSHVARRVVHLWLVLQAPRHGLVHRPADALLALGLQNALASRPVAGQQQLAKGVVMRLQFVEGVVPDAPGAGKSVGKLEVAHRVLHLAAVPTPVPRAVEVPGPAQRTLVRTHVDAVVVQLDPSRQFHGSSCRWLLRVVTRAQLTAMMDAVTNGMPGEKARLTERR